jgi:hypothetical protein
MLATSTAEEDPMPHPIARFLNVATLATLRCT